MIVRLATWLLLCAALSATSAGCVTIAPYERELLARPDMQFEGNREAAAAESHSSDTREGSRGGFGGGGGGCGCN